MQDQKDKNIIFIIVIIIVICILGICYYVKDFTKKNKVTTDIKKNTTNNLKKNDEKKNTFDVTKLDGHIRIEKIQVVKQCNNIIGENNNKQIVVLKNDEIYVANNQNEPQEVIRKLPYGSVIDLTCGGKDIVAWMEIDSKLFDGKETRYKSIYCYNMKDKSTTKIAEDECIENNDGVCLEDFQLIECLRIHDDKIYYGATIINENKVFKRVFMYNPADKKNTEVYTDDNISNKISDEMELFDIDYDKGYLFYNKRVENKDNGIDRRCLVRVDLKKKTNNKQVLAVSDDDINFSVQYPYTAFYLNKKVHLYNIEKGYDDACIKCSYPSIYGIDVINDKLIFSSDKVYCYFINDKKLKSFESSNRGSREGYFSNVRGDNVYWCSEGSMYYIKINDIN